MMQRGVTLAGVLTIGLLSAGLVFGDDAKPAKVDAPKDQVALPSFFNQLGLAEEQKQKLGAVHADLQPKIDALTKELKELHAKQDEAYGKILTEEQKTRLGKVMAALATHGADGRLKVISARMAGDSDNDKKEVKEGDKKEDKKDDKKKSGNP